MAGDPLDWLDDEAHDRERLGLVRTLHAYGGAVEGRVLDGEVPLVNFASNDYLGLAADPRVVGAAVEAASRYGWGSGASALVCGWREPHERLANELASFEGVEAVALFPSGFAANLGTVAALVESGDAVFADRLDHACLIAGSRLSGARLRVYPHNDAEALERLLTRERSQYRRVLIATDGVFSMDGDLAPLRRLVEVAEAFDAMLLVDEAHGTGVFGSTGRGAAEACGVCERVPIRVGTLSKALGSIGGFVAGSRRLVDHLIHRAPSLVYSTSLPPAAAAAASAALGIVRNEPQRRARVFEMADSLRAGLRLAGWAVPESQGPIVPVMVGEPEAAMVAAGRLCEAGFLVGAIRPPTVPRGTSRLRISVTAVHTGEWMRELAGALGAAQDRR
jgi:8-amino-7-oxononanoate synthase